MDVMSHRRRMMLGRRGGEVVPSNQIWYEADSQVELFDDVGVVSHTFYGGRGVITFDGVVTTVRRWLAMTSVERVYLPDSVTAIGYDALGSCSHLNRINIPDSVTAIGDEAFYGCPYLMLESLPGGIEAIGSYAFAYCPSIPSLTIPAVVPPVLGINAFDEMAFNIYVPAASVDAYKAASGWSEYADRIFAIN